mmetsp:Transcript_5531/g.17811  ORF Transcript_5531/g.17811 Transcript_5531/m.17811 type:complete len:223 (+) Transcript_5531:267-935(+)
MSRLCGRGGARRQASRHGRHVGEGQNVGGGKGSRDRGGGGGGGGGSGGADGGEVKGSGPVLLQLIPWRDYLGAEEHARDRFVEGDADDVRELGGGQGGLRRHPLLLRPEGGAGDQLVEGAPRLGQCQGGRCHVHHARRWRQGEGGRVRAQQRREGAPDAKGVPAVRKLAEAIERSRSRNLQDDNRRTDAVAGLVDDPVRRPAVYVGALVPAPASVIVGRHAA